MVNPIRFLFPLAGALVLAGPVGPASAQRGGAIEADPTPAISREHRAERLERWRTMSPAERAEMLRRLETWRAMRPEARAALERRGAELRRQRAELQRLLQQDDQDFGEMTHEERRARLRELQRERARSDAERIGARVPRDLAEELGRVAPAERPHRFELWRERAGGRLVERGARALARDLDLDEERIRALRDLAPRERRAALAALHREAVRRDVAHRGLPAGLDGARWQALEQLGDEEFLRAWRGHVRRGIGEIARGMPDWPQGASAARSVDPQLASALGRLVDEALEGGPRVDVGRPSPEQLESLRDLGTEERRLAVERLIGERIRARLGARTDLSDAERAAVAAATPRQLVDALQDALGKRRAADSPQRPFGPGGGPARGR